MAAITGVHHHRSTIKTPKKSFKSRKATKGSLKELAKGKVDELDRSHRRSPHQQLMSKLDRRNQARQKQHLKHQGSLKASSIFSGRDGAPRIVSVIPLCEDGSAQSAVEKLNASLDLEVEVPAEGLVRLNVDKFKQKLEYILVKRDLITALDACRVADFVMFILSAEQEVDGTGELLIRSIEGQGISNVVIVVQKLDSIEPAKRRPQIASSLKSYITHFFPVIDKVFSLDSRQECANIIRSLCSIMPKGVHWREARSWMLVEDVQWLDTNKDTGHRERNTTVVLSGTVRGRGLHTDRLVQVGDWGEFQIDKVTTTRLGNVKSRAGDHMAVDEEECETVLLEPTADQDELVDLAPEEVVMADMEDTPVPEVVTERKGVLLDDHHYFSDDETHMLRPPKRLPKGTSSYQSAWYLDDVSDSESEFGNEDQDGDISMAPPALPQDGTEGLDRAYKGEPNEYAPTEVSKSEMFLDLSPEEEAEQLAAFRSRQSDAKDDLEFPDEIELHPNVLARERLARFRGLKSLRTSNWKTDEDKAHQPEEWDRLLRIADYKNARTRAEREALLGGIQPGTKVHVYLRNVPVSFKNSSSLSHPLTLFSLLRHEHKRAVVNFNITLNSDYPSPIKSKEELILQCGPRRWVINPIFSQLGNTPNNVHKFDRYLHPSRTAIATFMGPLTWGSVPALVFKRASALDDGDMQTASTPSLQLIGIGTSQPPDHNRVVAKQVILTGHPYKIHKKLVTVRYMFFNKEDVNWFKALQLWTRRGRSGYIKESLGTHGYFKATFDGPINAQDAVGVSLHKRVFPRNAKPWKAGEEA